MNVYIHIHIYIYICVCVCVCKGPGRWSGGGWGCGGGGQQHILGNLQSITHIENPTCILRNCKRRSTILHWVDIGVFVFQPYNGCFNIAAPIFVSRLRCKTFKIPMLHLYNNVAFLIGALNIPIQM